MPRIVSPSPFTEEQLEDIRSAISFFRDKYPDRRGSVETRKAMKVIDEKACALIRLLRKEGK